MDQTQIIGVIQPLGELEEEVLVMVELSKIIEDFKKLDPAFKLISEEDLKDMHQHILDVGYSWWRNDAPPSTSYGDMITYMINTYGRFAGMMILVGKLNQQVENGGYTQYYDNGYADGEGGCFKIHDPSHPLHIAMIKEVEYFYENYFINLLEETDQNLISEFLRIQKKFLDLYIETDEEYEEEEYDDETEEYYQVMVSNPDHGLFTDRASVAKLDSEYYKISDELIKTWEKIVQIVYYIIK